MELQASPKQLEFWANCNHRWNFKTGATRSGKTYMDYFMIPRRLMEMKGKEGLNVILGNTQGTIQRNILDPMTEIYGGNRISSIHADRTVTMFGESVYVLGADNVAHVNKLRGASFKYVYGDEVPTWNRDVFNMVKSRLDKPYSKFDGTGNPADPEHWLKTFLDSDADIFQQAYTIDDNPFLDPSFVANLKKEYEGTVLYDRYILGEWAAAEGALFITHPEVIKDPKVLYDGFCHVDASYGGSDATAFTCAKLTGDMLYIFGKKWNKHVDTVMDYIVTKAKELRCEPLYIETNADKGYLGKAFRERGMTVRMYNETMNKFHKIATYGYKWWKNVKVLDGTDKTYLSEIQSYTEQAPHDDAPDSFSCCARIVNRSPLTLEYV